MNLVKIREGLAEEPRFNFFTFKDVNPQSGREKYRTVGAPTKAMLTLQRRFLKELRALENGAVRQELLRFSTSSNLGDSALANVVRHQQGQHFYLLDFSNAYHSVELETLVTAVKMLPSFRGVAEGELCAFLQRYFFDPKKGGLVQGGPASQDLFNLYAATRVDTPLVALLEEHSLTYTRYLDDMTFSSSAEETPFDTALRKQIRTSIIAAGFKISYRKCEVVDLKKRTVTITGFGLAEGGRLFVPRPYLAKLRGLLRMPATSEKEWDHVCGMADRVKDLLKQQPTRNRLEMRVIDEVDRYYAASSRRRW